MSWSPSTRGYFVLPDGRYFVNVSMGGNPARWHEPVTHPEVAKIAHLNPAVTHLEFARTDLYATRHPRAADTDFGVIVGLRVYCFVRALQQIGAPIHDRWLAVPLYLEDVLCPLE